MTSFLLLPSEIGVLYGFWDDTYSFHFDFLWIEAIHFNFHSRGTA
jgi:hypothetical protein